MRKLLSRMFEGDSQILVTGLFPNPIEALSQIPTLKPDVIICDIEMPYMNGLDFLKACNEKNIKIPVIICSAQADRAGLAIQAYSLGAIDVLLKPDMSSDKAREESKETFRRLILLTHQSRSRLRLRPTKSIVAPPIKRSSLQKIEPRSSIITRLIVLGASTGGPDAIKNFLYSLPPNMPPILIVQHMAPGFTSLFAQTLNKECSLKVKEAEPDEVIKNNCVYIAPGNKQMSLKRVASDYVLHIAQTPLVNGHRPAVDVLFDSVARIAPRLSWGIILTGMGNDGAKGMQRLKDAGCPLTVAQDEETCVVFGMPKEAIDLGKVDKILPLGRIGPFLVERLSRRESHETKK